MQDENDENEWGLTLAYRCALALMDWELEQAQRTKRLGTYIEDAEAEQLEELSEITLTFAITAQYVRLRLNDAPPAQRCPTNFVLQQIRCSYYYNSV